MNKNEKMYGRVEQAVSTIMKRIKEGFDQLDVELTRPQFFMLKTLLQKEKSTTSELATIIGVKPSAITTMIERLCNNGYVKRERDKEDRRIVYLSLTEEGKSILQQTKKQHDHIVQKELFHLNAEQLEMFVVLLESIAFDTEKK